MGSPIVSADLLDDAARRAAAYLDHARRRRVAPTGDAVAALDELAVPLPDASTDPRLVLDLLDRVGSPATVAMNAGRYFGFVNGAALPASMAATYLAAAWDQNASLRVMSPAAAAFEDVALAWARDILGLPAGCAGAIVTGATMANLTALAAARHALLERAGWDVERDGLFGAPPLTVVVGDEVHVSLLKALGLLGLGRQRVRRVAADGQGRIRADQVPALDDRTIVCLQAGNVNSGAFDPAAAICERAREAGAWVHVDGAFGLWAAASPRYRHLAAPFGQADSWATDAHKWPNVGYDCGLAFVRDAARPAVDHGDVLGLFRTHRGARAVAVHARDVATGPRHRVVGGVAVARPQRARRSDRPDVPSCGALRRGPSGPRL